MSHDTRAGALPSLAAETKDESGQRSIVLALMAMVVLLDQATKWWGWRHISEATINPGGDFLVEPTVGSWYADPPVSASASYSGSPQQALITGQ